MGRIEWLAPATTLMDTTLDWTLTRLSDILKLKCVYFQGGPLRIISATRILS
jgi:hypothetical protein